MSSFIIITGKMLPPSPTSINLQAATAGAKKGRVRTKTLLLKVLANVQVS